MRDLMMNNIWCVVILMTSPVNKWMEWKKSDGRWIECEFNEKKKFQNNNNFWAKNFVCDWILNLRNGDKIHFKLKMRIVEVIHKDRSGIVLMGLSKINSFWSDRNKASKESKQISTRVRQSLVLPRYRR